MSQVGRPPVQLTHAQERELLRVADAANRLDAAKEALRRAAVEAIDAGVPVLRVAEAGVTRSTLYRWLAESEVE